MQIQLPTKKGQPNTKPTVEIGQLVVIGANGSGKTRFGSDIENRYLGQTHRISAQKSLTFPNEVSTKSKDRAAKEFFYGNYYEPKYEQYHVQQKTGNRSGGNLNTFLLNDYEKLLVLLHTEEYEDSLNFKEGNILKPITKLDRVQKLWETVLPHRKILKGAGVIETFPLGNEQAKYNASEMSDGERVLFYLAGEVICAPQNSIIIIDEPEMHIHTSLIKTFFDLLEAERNDCPFIYLTHNIDFAFSRQNAINIWAKSYEGNDVWDYELLEDHLPIPEQLYLEVLGSRKHIIFLEGESSSIDYELYEQVYSNYTIKPLGSCEKVIQTVKSFNEQNGFHHLQANGIIDRDRRPNADLSKLNSKGIWVLDVAEAENLLLEEHIVKVIAYHMGRNQDDIFNQVKENLIAFFNSQLDSQILLHYKEILRRAFLDITNFTSTEPTSVNSEIDFKYFSIDKKVIYDKIKSDFTNVISTGDYDGILRLFNLKNALIPQSKICDLTGIKNKDEYFKLVLTLLKRNNEVSTTIKNAIDRKVLKKSL